MPGKRRESVDGQSLVEFALVLPILLVLLLGIADFGRVFTAGIVLEASARNAAEAAAQEYLQLCRNRTTCPPLDAADYAALHDLALSETCREAERLPNRAVDGSGVCTMPYAAVCVHDGADPLCAAEAASAPGECSLVRSMAPNPSNAALAYDASAPPYVEVRICYRFTTMVDISDLDLPFGSGLSLGEIWLQRERSFTSADY
jgi:hypothetical protein